MITISTLWKDLIPDFLKHRKKDLETIRQYIDNAHWTELAKAVHRFKGTSGSYGFQELSALAQALEVLIPEKNKPSLSLALEKIKVHLETLTPDTLDYQDPERE